MLGKCWATYASICAYSTSAHATHKLLRARLDLHQQQSQQCQMGSPEPQTFSANVSDPSSPLSGTAVVGADIPHQAVRKVLISLCLLNVSWRPLTPPVPVSCPNTCPVSGKSTKQRQEAGSRGPRAVPRHKLFQVVSCLLTSVCANRPRHPLSELSCCMP